MREVPAILPAREALTSGFLRSVKTQTGAYHFAMSLHHSLSQNYSYHILDSYIGADGGADTKR
jgi:hypothetical protein